MRKTIIGIFIAASLTACAGGVLSPSVTTFVDSVISFTRQSCGWIVQAETVLAIIKVDSSIANSVDSVANVICDAVRVKSSRLGAKSAPRYKGVIIKGHFERI